MKKRRFFSCFFSLLLIAGLFAGTFSPALAEEAAPAASEESVLETDAVEETAPPPIVLQDPDIQARGAILVDLNNGGKMIYGKNERMELYPASLTKIMTALLTLEAVEEGRLTLDTEITVSAIVRSMPAGSSTAGLKEGEVMSVRNLLYCLLVQSANEAADVLAEAVSGSVVAFVQAMNQMAASLGCENTHFTNSHGFHDTAHYTSCQDMALITMQAMKYPAFMTICDTDRYIVPATNMSPERTLLSTNHLISLWRNRNYKNPEVHGVKTGSTDAAGHCLVATAERGSKHYLSVVMGAEELRENGVQKILSFSETTRLFNWGFENFAYTKILDAGEPMQEVPVELSRTDHVIAEASREIQALIPAKLDPSMMERVIHLDANPLTAPVEEGQKLGTMELRYDGVTYGTADLLASHGAELSKLLSFQRTAAEWIRKPIVWAAAGVAALAGTALAVRVATSGRRRYGSSSRSNGYRGRR